MATCSSCNAETKWAKFRDSGKFVMLDPEPVPGGNLAMKNGHADNIPRVWVVKPEELEGHPVQLGPDPEDDRPPRLAGALQYVPTGLGASEESMTDGLARLRALGDTEIPDSRLPLARRRRLKLMARVIAEEHSAEECMYLAGAIEQRAGLKKGGR